MSKDIHRLIRKEIEDLTSKFLYYDRKEDLDFPIGAIEKAVDNNEITLGDIVDYFSDEISKVL